MAAILSGIILGALAFLLFGLLPFAAPAARDEGVASIGGAITRLSFDRFNQPERYAPRLIRCGRCASCFQDESGLIHYSRLTQDESGQQCGASIGLRVGAIL
jgi:hypothetical protein